MHYDKLPIFKSAMDLVVYTEMIARRIGYGRLGVIFRTFICRKKEYSKRTKEEK